MFLRAACDDVQRVIFVSVDFHLLMLQKKHLFRSSLPIGPSLFVVGNVFATTVRVFALHLVLAIANNRMFLFLLPRDTFARGKSLPPEAEFIMLECQISNSCGTLILHDIACKHTKTK